MARVTSRLVAALAGSLLASGAFAAEADYQRPWCQTMGGRLEIVVKGGRIDCLTDRYAVEFDFARKWKECISQARWYGLQTGKIPACALIVSPSDDRYLRYIEDYLSGTDTYVKVITVPK